MFPFQLKYHWHNVDGCSISVHRGQSLIFLSGARRGWELRCDDHPTEWCWSPSLHHSALPWHSQTVPSQRVSTCQSVTGENRAGMLLDNLNFYVRYLWNWFKQYVFLWVHKDMTTAIIATLILYVFTKKTVHYFYIDIFFIHYAILR